MTEQTVREKWASFCEDAKALGKDGYRVQPGRTLDDPVSISETGAVKRQAPEKKEAPVQADSKRPLFPGKQSKKAEE